MLKFNTFIKVFIFLSFFSHFIHSHTIIASFTVYTLHSTAIMLFKCLRESFAAANNALQIPINAAYKLWRFIKKRSNEIIK